MVPPSSWPPSAPSLPGRATICSVRNKKAGLLLQLRFALDSFGLLFVDGRFFAAFAGLACAATVASMAATAAAVPPNLVEGFFIPTTTRLAGTRRANNHASKWRSPKDATMPNTSAENTSEKYSKTSPSEQ